MFRERIDNTPFTTEEADFYFSSIHTDGTTQYAGDKSFLATARALLYGRIPEGEELAIVYRNYHLSKTDADRFDDTRVLESVVGTIPFSSNRFTVTELVESETAGRCLEILEKEFTSKYPGWAAEEKSNIFFKKSVAALCFINEAQHATVIFTDRMTLRKWHYLQVSLGRCVPWFFPEGKGITDTEKALIFSLKRDTPTEYLGILRSLVSQYDFEKSRIKRLLSGFEMTYERRRIDALERDIRSHNEAIERCSNEMMDLVAKVRDLNLTLSGAKLAVESRGEESEIMDYFLANSNIGLENASNGCLSFTVKGCLEDFDQDEAEACIGNDRSFVYSCYQSGNRVSKEDMKRLMTAVFVDQTIKLRFCAAYTFVIGDRIRVDAQSDKNYGAEFSSYLPNPHIQRYSCMGNHRILINDMLRNGDYVGAIAQCETSCKSLAWGDNTVMCSFMREMYTTDRTCFELPDGKCVDQVGAVAWLKEQEG